MCRTGGIHRGLESEIPFYGVKLLYICHTNPQKVIYWKHLTCCKTERIVECLRSTSWTGWKVTFCVFIPKQAQTQPQVDANARIVLGRLEELCLHIA